MKAVYRWSGPAELELETIVEARTVLTGFEVFLASYFDGAFTRSFALVKGTPEADGRPTLFAADRSLGEWLMFPRGPKVLSVIPGWPVEARTQSGGMDDHAAVGKAGGIAAPLPTRA